MRWVPPGPNFRVNWILKPSNIEELELMKWLLFFIATSLIQIFHSCEIYPPNFRGLMGAESYLDALLYVISLRYRFTPDFVEKSRDIST